MWILAALALTICVLGVYSVRAWLVLLHEERAGKICPQCGTAAMPDPTTGAAGAFPSCNNCPIKGCPFRMSARGWINSPLRPPD
jgi:hypothetical protein